MKLTIHPTYQDNVTAAALFILVNADTLRTTADHYKIKNLDSITQAVQFKSGFNESLSLTAQDSLPAFSQLIGLGSSSELQPAKLAKLAQTIVDRKSVV